MGAGRRALLPSDGGQALEAAAANGAAVVTAIGAGATAPSWLSTESAAAVAASAAATRRAALAQWFEAVLENAYLRSCPATAAFVSECSADWAEFLRPL